MRQLNAIYFAKEGEYGLTETQASHLCALANQVKEQHEATLANVNFINTTLSIVGQEGEHTTDAGFDSLSEIETAIAEISRMNAFIAWFAEARKELEEYRDERTKYDVYAWAEEIGIDWMDGMPLTTAQISTFYHNPDLQQMLDHLSALGYVKYEHPKKLIRTESAQMVKHLL